MIDPIVLSKTIKIPSVGLWGQILLEIVQIRPALFGELQRSGLYRRTYPDLQPGVFISDRSKCQIHIFLWHILNPLHYFSSIGREATLWSLYHCYSKQHRFNEGEIPAPIWTKSLWPAATPESGVISCSLLLPVLGVKTRVTLTFTCLCRLLRTVRRPVINWVLYFIRSGTEWTYDDNRIHLDMQILCGHYEVINH